MIYVGQIYEQKNGEILAVTQVYHSRHVSVIYSDGYVQNYDLKEDNGSIFEKPIANYLTWQEAVNSMEFRG